MNSALQELKQLLKGIHDRRLGSIGLRPSCMHWLTSIRTTLFLARLSSLRPGNPLVSDVFPPGSSTSRPIYGSPSNTPLVDCSPFSLHSGLSSIFRAIYDFPPSRSCYSDGSVMYHGEYSASLVLREASFRMLSLS